MTAKNETLFAALVGDARACRACPRMEGRRRVLSELNGPLLARVLFIAEAPGRLGGDKGGIPLTGDASGRNFLRYLSAAGLKREDVFVTNAALCNPRTERGTNAPPSASEIRACSAFLSRTLDIVQPAVIATLGTKALAAKCLERGLLILTCGIDGNVVRLLTPLTASEKVLNEGLDILEAAILGN